MNGVGHFDQGQRDTLTRRIEREFMHCGIVNTKNGNVNRTERFPCRMVLFGFLPISLGRRLQLVCALASPTYRPGRSACPPSQQWRIKYLPLPGFPATT